MTRNYILLNLLLILLFSCGNPVKKDTPIDYENLLITALIKNDFYIIKSTIPRVRLTENSQNIIKLYQMLYTEGDFKINREMDYLQQFYPQMNFVHQTMLNEVKIWLSLKKIYHKEISPPVRILQRDLLYLAPSKIDFEACNQINNECANDTRKKLYIYIDAPEVSKRLKQMARRDPCVNLSNKLQNQEKAGRCLKKSKGNLVVELLPPLHFNSSTWKQALFPNK